MNQQKRLRVFAGPNGYGKTSLVKLIQNQNVNLGTYVNADEIKVQLDIAQGLSFLGNSLQISDLIHGKPLMRFIGYSAV